LKRGDIYWANLQPRSGSEQPGQRPVLIISHDGFNETEEWNSVIVIPLSTSTRQFKQGPTTVHLSKGTASLSKGSLVLAHQITTIDRKKLSRRLGSLSKTSLLDVEVALKAAVNLT
jgi:mRNA interferase MazF